jgi:hypothetical protein
MHVAARRSSLNDKEQPLAAAPLLPTGICPHVSKCRELRLSCGGASKARMFTSGRHHVETPVGRTDKTVPIVADLK